MKRERLTVSDFVEDPVVTWPAWYMLSGRLRSDEMLLESLRAIHLAEFEGYTHPRAYEEIFSSFASGLYPIYLYRYATAFFGGRVMYLESGGWKTMPLTAECFDMEKWLIPE